ncbi:hypothetical protein GDO78_004553 [Eleutherodactylus coqui]|uniref:Uncharacterized protein n=1 Tax=Eleutherodactylus coqui TaxID=57060 RepID=A0A8J6JZX2_ELECQ|nr:hypothetical protein GDO78_004553 [Eleutherodactylus coqui]
MASRERIMSILTMRLLRLIEYFRDLGVLVLQGSAAQIILYVHSYIDSIIPDPWCFLCHVSYDPYFKSSIGLLSIIHLLG